MKNRRQKIKGILKIEKMFKMKKKEYHEDRIES